MRCPHCGDRETRVVDSRDLDDSATIRRRRECAACATRFTTYERVEAARLVVVKRDGTRQEFDRDKLVSGLRKALTRRPSPTAPPRPPPTRSRPSCARPGTSEVPSSRVGALAMEQLRAIDQIAYIRFASVYQSFEDLEDLKREVDTLYAERGTPGSLRRVSVLSDRDIRAALEAGRVAHRPVRRRRTSSRRRSTSTSTGSFRVFRNNRYPYIDVRAPQPDLTELLTSTTTSRSSSTRRVRPRPDARMGRAARRPRRAGSRARARWGASACSSTRRRATSTRAGRAT